MPENKKLDEIVKRGYNAKLDMNAYYKLLFLKNKLTKERGRNFSMSDVIREIYPEEFDDKALSFMKESLAEIAAEEEK